MNREELNRLFTLCGALRDEIITEEEFRELDELLRRSPEAQGYYLDYIYLCTDLCNLQAAVKHTPSEQAERADHDPADSDAAESPLTLEMLQVLGDYEKRAEVLEIPAPEKPRKVIEKVVIESQPYRSSKLSIITFAISLAAFFVLLAYIHFNPRVSFEVATVVGAVNAEWSASLPLHKGLRLPVSSESFHIQKGVLELESDKGVNIVLEAPAGFYFRSPDEIYLDYGRAYARVPAGGSGFSIQTGSSKIIDLGTEFGVHTDTRGETELHVFKGNTVLITGGKNKPQKTREVPAGKAMRVSHFDGRVTDIEPCRKMFVQQIDPDLGLVWRGDRVLSLADMVGGGNGMGTGRLNTGINPSSRDGEEPSLERYRPSSNRYNPVSRNPFLDGVFVPDGSTPQIVTSERDRFAQCPVTSGYFYSDIACTDLEYLCVKRSDPSSDDPDPNGFAAGDDLILYMHANAGITFDLNEVRRQWPGIRLSRFQSTIGIMKSVRDKPVPSRAEFWVLADGKVRYHRALLPEMKEPIEVVLGENDRFLTLVTTDGGSLELELDRHAIGHDLCVFVNPVLVLK